MIPRPDQEVPPVVPVPVAPVPVPEQEPKPAAPEAAPASTAAPAVEAKAKEPAAAADPRLVPESLGREGDERPLALLQHEFLKQVLQAETEALKLEASLAATASPPDAKRFQRIAADRELVGGMLAAAKKRPGAAGLAPKSITLVDRFLHDFANDRLESGGYSRPLLEAWEAANRTFLASSKLEDRDAAIAQREPALNSLESSALLRQLVIAIEDGSLTDAERESFVGKLKSAYPDAPLPAVEFTATAAATAAAHPIATVPAPVDPGNGLPRLDGAERPSGTLPDLKQVLKTPAPAGK